MLPYNLTKSGLTLFSTILPGNKFHLKFWGKFLVQCWWNNKLFTLKSLLFTLSRSSWERSLLLMAFHGSPVPRRTQYGQMWETSSLYSISTWTEVKWFSPQPPTCWVQERQRKKILLLRSVPTNTQSHLLLHVVSIYFNKQQSLSIYFTSFLRSVGSFEKWLPRDVYQCFSLLAEEKVWGTYFMMKWVST